ncbi:MAG: hypothetical protein KDD39_16500, partial [Bdellovibrionales bacterium]|nr:hypothetical protein [Bdellovibrionales bacterium]
MRLWAAFFLIASLSSPAYSDEPTHQKPAEDSKSSTSDSTIEAPAKTPEEEQLLAEMDKLFETGAFSEEGFGARKALDEKIEELIKKDPEAAMEALKKMAAAYSENVGEDKKLSFDETSAKVAMEAWFRVQANAIEKARTQAQLAGNFKKAFEARLAAARTPSPELQQKLDRLTVKPTLAQTRKGEALSNQNPIALKENEIAVDLTKKAPPSLLASAVKEKDPQAFVAKEGAGLVNGSMHLLNPTGGVQAVELDGKVAEDGSAIRIIDLDQFPDIPAETKQKLIALNGKDRATNATPISPGQLADAVRFRATDSFADFQKEAGVNGFVLESDPGVQRTAFERSESQVGDPSRGRVLNGVALKDGQAITDPKKFDTADGYLTWSQDPNAIVGGERGSVTLDEMVDQIIKNPERAEEILKQPLRHGGKEAIAVAAPSKSGHTPAPIFGLFDASNKAVPSAP